MGLKRKDALKNEEHIKFAPYMGLKRFLTPIETILIQFAPYMGLKSYHNNLTNCYI